MNINEQTVLITGGASGMGAATARYFAQQGATVAVADISNAVHDTAQSIGGTGYICDVSDPQSVADMLDALIKKSGTPRIVINCAGICPGARVLGREEPHPLDLFENALRINLAGTFNIMRLAAEKMAAEKAVNDEGERGVIINTASIAAYEGQIGQAAYAASKGGIVSMTLPIAREFAQFGIRVMTIAPGIMETPMITAMPDKVQESLKANTLFPPRLGQPQEFAKLAAHICENVMLNGETIRLDGALRLAPK